MCGIFGIVLNNNNENIYNLIIEGLIQLQNRGYDSAGVCVIKNNKFEVNKCASTNKLNALDKLISMTDIKESKDDTYIGIGHNRWATHGVKNDTNAHPHLSSDTNFVIVHNGIIENYNEIKQKLIKEGFIFHSQTDTEVIVNLLQYNYNNNNNNNNNILNNLEGTNMTHIIKQTIEELRGTYGLLIQSLYEPNKLYCVRNGSPLLIGQNDEEVIVTSEQSGFCNLYNAS
jgi:glucosamine--fructose-6-phosphate aminotransferase (isomerizing)